MRRSWVLGFAPLFLASPALAQEVSFPVPPVVIPPIVVPVPVPQVVPVPLPLPVPAPQPVPVPFPQAEPPPQMVAPPWQAPALPPPPPAPPPKKLRGVLLAEDLGAALPIRSPDTRTVGYTADTRIGYRFPLGPVWLAPEVTVGWVGFPQYSSALRFGAGAHLGLNGEVVEPSIYVLGGGFWEVFKQGPGVRAGASLDFRAGRFVLPGVHVDYDYASWDTNSVKFVGAGAHVGFLVGR